MHLPSTMKSGQKMPVTDQVWQILLTVIVQTMTVRKIVTVESESLDCYAECDDFESVNTILGEIFAYSEDSDELCY